MANSIEEALKKAVEKTDSTKVVEGEGSEPSPSTTFVESVFSTAFFKASSILFAIFKAF